MERITRTTGDRALDAEIDALYKAVTALKNAPASLSQAQMQAYVDQALKSAFLSRALGQLSDLLDVLVVGGVQGQTLIFDGSRWQNSSQVFAPASGNVSFFGLGDAGYKFDAHGNDGQFARMPGGGIYMNNRLSLYNLGATELSVGSGWFAVEVTNLFRVRLIDAGTTDVSDAMILRRQSYGTPGAGFGLNLPFSLESSTTDAQPAGKITALWNVATHASRAADMIFTTQGYGSDAEALRFRWGASGALLAFFGGTPAAKPTVSGTRDANAALASLLTGLSGLGILTDSTTAGTAPSGGSTVKLTMGHRLTLESGVPISASDQTAKTTVYMTPYISKEIALYYSSAWAVCETAEISVAVPSNTNTPFDIFAYWNGSAVALEAVAWITDSARATAIVQQDGVWVKNIATDRRYIGTGRTTAVSGQTEDSECNRYLWNMFNRVTRVMRKAGTTSHTYSSATIRAWNNDATIRLSVVLGFQDQAMFIGCRAGWQGLNTTSFPRVAIGYDSTSGYLTEASALAQVSTGASGYFAFYLAVAKQIGIGGHYLQAIEQGDGTNSYTYILAYLTATWEC